MAVKSAGVSSRLRRALAGVLSLASGGLLPESCRWILDSRLIFLQKQKGPKPRPIRVGEVWRRLIAKRVEGFTSQEVLGGASIR
jgi:hypothetical protein